MDHRNWARELAGKKIIIWGASAAGRQLHGLLTRNALEPAAYCDNDKNKQGTEYDDIPVISFENLCAGTQDDGNCAIIIATLRYEEVYEQIRAQSIGAEVYIYLLYDPCELKSGCREYSRREKEQIRALYEDEEYTQRLLNLMLDKGFLNTDAIGGIEDYIGYSGVDAYYYDAIANRLPERCTLLDVGSYTGDSIIQIGDVLGARMARAYAFEPNRENWEQIERKHFKDVTLYKVALSDKKGREYFSESGPFFMASDEETDVSIETARLDDLDMEVDGRTILKIDIEGSEMKCLKGAGTFIKTYKPCIAVCVYHRENDVFEIPNYIKGLVPDYRFLLRGGMHTVCYAFPEE